MSSVSTEDFDVVIIGSGPAGQKAAQHAARHGQRVLVIEKSLDVGGECVHRGTIPSKTLRETTIALSRFKARTGDVFGFSPPAHLQIASLLKRMDQVIRGHVGVISGGIEGVGAKLWHGRASFVDARTLNVMTPNGETRKVRGATIIIATGSRPRQPDNVAIDHEHILDSDSLLSMIYLPRSLTVLGGGVIACEYASIFASLGVEVTLVAREALPLRWMDPELSRRFKERFEAMGGVFLGQRNIERVMWDGVNSVVTALADGEEVRSEKAVCALGRVANVKGLGLKRAGLTTSGRGHVPVDAHCRTSVSHIYAVGDVIGPPSLAATSAEQGRRAVHHALGLEAAESFGTIPAGVYAIPEMSMVGMTESQAREAHGDAMVGRASFAEVARGLIANIPDGFLKLVTDPDGRKLLGVHIIGEGATELIHLGQMALIGGMDVDTFIDHIFNFPTLAEAYRVAALEVVAAREARTGMTGVRACA